MQSTTLTVCLFICWMTGGESSGDQEARRKANIASAHALTSAQRGDTLRIGTDLTTGILDFASVRYPVWETFAKAFNPTNRTLPILEYANQQMYSVPKEVHQFDSFLGTGAKACIYQTKAGKIWHICLWSLGRNGLRNGDIRDLSKLPATLSYLDLSGNKLTKFNANRLPSGLQRLWLCYNQIKVVVGLDEAPETLQKITLVGNAERELTDQLNRQNNGRLYGFKVKKEWNGFNLERE